MPPSPLPAGEVRDVTCPFCGLLCDDLVVDAGPEGLAVAVNGCPKAAAGFRREPRAPAVTPRVGGRPSSLEDAVAAAARLLGESRQPLIGGLGTDLEGMRAATALADRTGAVLDHMNSAAGVRNQLVLQDGGWITTTLSEVRNHADLLLVAGSDIATRLPRFFERCVDNRETLFHQRRRCETIYLGRGPRDPATPGGGATVLECEPSRLHEVFGALRALLASRSLTTTVAGGIPVETLEGLAGRLRRAHYGVVAWVAADLDVPHAELTIQSICELVRELNRHTRFAGLPLGGSDGDVTADAVLLWQTGFGLRTSLAQGRPVGDLHLHSAARMLASGEADVLLWVSSFDPARTPPPTDAPAIVLGHAAMTLDREPAVFIPVGTPGVEHAGHLFRTDRVVALPVGAFWPSPLASAAAVMSAIAAALPEGGPC